MKTNISLFGLVLLLVLTVLATFIALPAMAAPRADQQGLTPIWDSGWVQTTVANQNFVHNLEAYPTLWTVLVADNSDGYQPIESPHRHVIGSSRHGHLVIELQCQALKIGWQAASIGYSSLGGKYYYRGQDWARILIYSADPNATPSCPYRP